MAYAGVGNAEVENLLWGRRSFEENAYILYLRKCAKDYIAVKCPPKSKNCY